MNPLAGLWLLLAPAFAQVDDLEGAGLDPISRNLYMEGLTRERQGSWARAAVAYGVVMGRDPTYAPAVVAYGRMKERLGDRAAAERAYRTLPMDADAVESLAQLILVEHPDEALILARRLRSLRLGSVEPYLLEARASLEAGLYADAAEALDHYLTEQSPTEELGELAIRLAAAFKDAGDRAQARVWLERVRSGWPGGALADEATARLERMDVEDAAENLAIGGGEELDAAQRAALEGARRLLAAGERDRARAALEALLRESPRSAELWATKGDLFLDYGDVAEAERAFVTALALDPDEPGYHVRLGRLLAARYGGRRHREAAEELRLALTLRPGWSELCFELGVVLQESGDFDGAIEALRAYLSRAPDGENASAAAARIDDLQRQRPEPPEVEQLVARPPEGVSPEAWEHFKLAQVWLREREDDGKARVEVEESLRLAPDYTDALNLLAGLQLRAGDAAAARATYERSLAVDPEQPLIVLAVGYALEEDGDRAAAEARFEQAAALGADEAWFAMARLAEERGDWWQARVLLREFFSRSSGGRVHARAEALREDLEARFRERVAIGVGVSAGVLGLPLAFLLRRNSGTTLREVLESEPELYQEVAAVLGRMRHEVLKHNTTVLPAVADAVARGENQSAALERLLSPEGAVRRWWDAVGELEALCARAGSRLNARVRDPVLAPMCRAFTQLERLGAKLRRGPNPGLAGGLYRISEALNGVGYAELGRILREVCVLRVDEAFLRGCVATVRGEPAFRELQLPEVELQAPEAMPVRIFRREMEDAVINVLRNGFDVVHAERGAEARLGLTLLDEVDPITGREWVVLRFTDNAHSPLSDEMIRGRYIDRGFGITVELLRRRQGSVHVEAAPGWSKAITLRLPRADIEEDA